MATLRSYLMSLPKDSLPANVRAALERGSAIEAIKLLREVTGLGLKEAKDLIDRHQVGKPTPMGVGTAGSAIPPEALAALEQGNKIEAIRLLRERTGLGLKEAKQAVESVQAESQGSPSLRSPGEVAKSSNTFWLVAALVALAVLAYLVFNPG
jgi:ribosomal protein L7/L12